MPRRRRRRLRTRGDEFFGLGGGFLVGYMGAEAVMQRFMHPLHWAAGAIAGALGYAGVWLWYYWRRARREERASREG